MGFCTRRTGLTLALEDRGEKKKSDGEREEERK